MRPEAKGDAWRRTVRQERHAQEPAYYPPAQRTRRQRERDLSAQTEAFLAREAHLARPEASMLPVLLLGCPGVDVITLTDGESTS